MKRCSYVTWDGNRCPARATVGKLCRIHRVIQLNDVRLEPPARPEEQAA